MASNQKKTYKQTCRTYENLFKFFDANKLAKLEAKKQEQPAEVLYRKGVLKNFGNPRENICTEVCL